jgi:replicative superfamily II helicase/very-short-patch-repair endonuclease
MPLHPIAIADQALAEYRSYLFTEFRARDPELRAALERALDEPRFLAQEPFFQAHRPFATGRRWSDLGLDARLAGVMRDRSRSEAAFLHQSDAIAHLLGHDPGPLVVTTGTGSGKTECFLLPVIQNAIEDAARFQRSGITAILIYPMNALANDQEGRIQDYLAASGHTYIDVKRYDRQTPQDERERMRQRPPHILLTNYMMLEYLLVRPADREALFANHRCRFLVLDEVHTYRGTLGSNIALLIRRLFAHLRHARQDWGADDRRDARRFPSPLIAGTSATIKSVDETGRSPEEVRRLRDEAVQEFFGRLTGVAPGTVRVIGESLRDLEVPPEARWPAAPVAIEPPDHGDPEAVRRAIAALAGLDDGTPLDQAVGGAAILWKLAELLAKKPRSVGGIVECLRAEVPERRDGDADALRREIEAALVAGAALPDGVAGALRLRTHRFLRGGWRFHRCIVPGCGRLYPMGEAECACGGTTAPLYLCRSCGVDTLRFEAAGSPPEALRASLGTEDAEEWILYDRSRHPEAQGADDVSEMKGRPVLEGSFDPATGSFSPDTSSYPMPVVLAPARNRCLLCGAFAGAGSVLTPVALGTSAAVRVIAEGLAEGLAAQHARNGEGDGKERLLIFADSRQDAAHQARFITYAGRYDRMRRRLVGVLEAAGGTLSVENAVHALLVRGVEERDNVLCERYDDARYLPPPVRSKAAAWEEVPLLDDLAVSAGYRGSVFNLGLVGVRYQHLEQYLEERGGALASDLGLSLPQLVHLARCLLDEMRRRGALSRPLLRYHPINPSAPEGLRAADWERRANAPNGYACEGGVPVGAIDRAQVPEGVTCNNNWRRSGAGGSAPSLQRRFVKLMQRFGGSDATEDRLVALLQLLTRGPRLIDVVRLYGHRRTIDLLQVNADCCELVRLAAGDRRRCSICNVRLPWAELGAPCPACPGDIVAWPEAEVTQSRYVQRILSTSLLPLRAGEHTAQITGEERMQLESAFKGPPSQSAINVLACSPTLEMGIDVGGLDAVVMRNVPPRPDNYAQRGGRAGRRSRVGVVLGYARSTPHDGYFYDRPEEMIAGEVPAPVVSLGNRDVLLRHLHAIAFGAADPGLSGKMGDYITLQGDLIAEPVGALIQALTDRFDHAARLAHDAWGPEILEPAGLGSIQALRAALDELPARVRDLFDRVSFQIRQLEETIRRWLEMGRGDRAAVGAMELKRRLLGIRDDRDSGREADDRTSGHPMRRFAEFGILPGYEFPSEPATLRLLGDNHEEETISVERRFGLAQYQPEATVHARGHRWRVAGLDAASPWNPRSPEPGWIYAICRACGLRYGAQEHVGCPRCGSDETVRQDVPGYELGGFLAVRNDAPVLDEEERFAMANLVQVHPQWSGDVVRRFRLPTGWHASLRREEEIRWVNEWKPPSPADFQTGRPMLHAGARGFYLCPACGRILTAPEASEPPAGSRGRRRPARQNGPDTFNHSTGCLHAGRAPAPLAMTARSAAATFRIHVDLPPDLEENEYSEWGLSLGYALRTGMRQLYMLDGPEVELVLEPMWAVRVDDTPARRGALTFIDAAVGGSGFLERAAGELHLVAARAIDHLDHPGCESACYRCLKAYNNQRHHGHLFWPRILPDLEALRAAAPERLPAERGDIHDPRPWLEAYAAGVGSPLELAFLRLFEQHGLAVEKQVPVGVLPGAAPISTADFAIPASRVAIYVDGAAFHRGSRLRRDRSIRDRLRQGGWRVVELRAEDLQRAAEVVASIQRLAVLPP